MKMRGEVVATTVVAVERARAFAIFTQHTRAWWRPEPRFRFRAHGRGHLELTGRAGGEVLDVGEDGERQVVGHVTLWQPPERLSFAWELAQPTEVEVCFEAVAQGTRVTVTHRGFGPVEVAFKNMISLRWGDLLVGLMRGCREAPPALG